MPNIFAPFGFNYVSQYNASAPNYSPAAGRISRTNSAPIYRGDPVTFDENGYIVAASPSSTQLAGIFQGCEYMPSGPGGSFVYRNMWTGAPSIDDPVAYYIDAPEAVFAVQSGNGGPVTRLQIGESISFLVGAGDNITGQSRAFVDFSTVEANPALPFRIADVAGQLSVNSTAPLITGNGSDANAPFNVIYVRFGQTILSGGSTAIISPTAFQQSYDAWLITLPTSEDSAPIGGYWNNSGIAVKRYY